MRAQQVELLNAYAIKGYDGIVTTDGKYTSEIINLTNFDEAKAKYSIASSNSIKASKTEADSQRQYREIEEHFFNKDGSEKPGAMLAPNGKRSKLTKYQWIMVRTDNFKRFYGDWERDGYRLENLGQDAGESTYSGGIYSRNNGAAPISETGEPLVFYHGTSDDIKTGFDLEH